MDAREEQAHEILRDMGIDPRTYFGERKAEAVVPKAQNDEKRLEKLLHMLDEHSPTGKKIVDNALKNKGVQIFFEKGMDCAGVYNKEHKSVTLNAAFSDETLVATLVHESRHAAQETVRKGNLKSLILGERASEADAMAHECAAAYEMKEAFPKVWQTFARSHAPVARAYETAALKDAATALPAAFEGWFADRSYVGRYDADIVNCAVACGLIRPEIELSDEKILTAACVPGKGKAPYVDPSFMKTDKALSVSKSTAFAMRLAGLPAKDGSIYEMRVRPLFGAPKPLKKKGVSASFAAFLAPRPEAKPENISEIPADKSTAAPGEKNAGMSVVLAGRLKGESR